MAVLLKSTWGLNAPTHACVVILKSFFFLIGTFTHACISFIPSFVPCLPSLSPKPDLLCGPCAEPLTCPTFFYDGRVSFSLGKTTRPGHVVCDACGNATRAACLIFIYGETVECFCIITSPHPYNTPQLRATRTHAPAHTHTQVLAHLSKYVAYESRT